MDRTEYIRKYLESIQTQTKTKFLTMGFDTIKLKVLNAKVVEPSPVECECDKRDHGKDYLVVPRKTGRPFNPIV